MTLAALLAVAASLAAPARTSPDEQTLLAAGLATDGPALEELLRDRARLDVDPRALADLAARLSDVDPVARGRAEAALVRRGAAAVPVLRRVANDLEGPERAEGARRCLGWVEGENAAALPAAAVRLLARRRPPGAVEALLEYLPAAEAPALVEEVTVALAALARPDGRPHPALLRALAGKASLGRAVAAAALCRAGGEPPPEARGLLADPAPQVRFRAALALAEAGDAEAVPVLIDLLADVPPEQRQQAEDVLHRLAGEWAPSPALKGDDDISRRIRRDAWAAWWKNTDGPRLLAELRRHTLTPAQRERAEALIARLGDESFEARQRAAAELVALGARVVPLLKAAARGADAERARLAEECRRHIAAREPRLPDAALRLLAVRRPDGAVEALLDYLPFAEEDERAEEARAALAALAVRGGKADPALVRALGDRGPGRRGAAAVALAQAGQSDAARGALRDDDPEVRVRVALALAGKGDKGAVPVLIDALADEPSGWNRRAEVLLQQLAGERAPAVEPPTDAEGRRRARDAWAAWWKEAAATADLSALAAGQGPYLDLTLIVDTDGRVLELGRDKQPRWVIDKLQDPVDAHVLPGDRVLIAERKGKRVTERDFRGNVLWQKAGLDAPVVNAQRLPDGHTFIATRGGLLEVDRAGRTVRSVRVEDLKAAYRGRDGVVTCLAGDQCVRLTMDGKELRRFPSGCGKDDDVGLEVLPNGHVLVAQGKTRRAVELDAAGKAVWEATGNDAVSTATRLSNGHTLITCPGGTPSIVEVDRSGKVVWEYDADTALYRARRR
jgi:HEAT repeat protein